MEIKTLTASQLINFIVTDEFKKMPVIPISSHRALSHSVNPRLEPNDVVMILAYKQGNMVGYLGVLADRIFEKDNSFKCGWLSCMWVDPKLRGKGIAKQLLATAFSNWQNHILVTEFTPEAKALYDRSQNFDHLKSNSGLRCFMRFNLHEILPSKNPRLKPFTPLLKIGDGLGNLVNKFRLLFKPINTGVLHWKKTEEIDADVANFIDQAQSNSFERRGVVELNWILKNPWLKVSQQTIESKKYHFSSVADKFKNLCFVARNPQSQPIAFLFLSIRNGHMKIPYAFFNETHSAEIAAKIYEVMLAEQVNMFTVFHPALVRHFSDSQTPFIYKRSIKRNYIIAKALSEHFHNKANIIIQDGDADCAFT